MLELDHLLWAAPDLDDGTATIAALTGVTPVPGGAHPGYGTRNSLLSLGSTYLEIIAPDPAQTLSGNRGGAIAALPKPGLLTFAMRTPDLASFAAAAKRVGLAVPDAVDMSRTRPDGVRLSWTIQPVRSDAFLDFIPFAIDWRGSPHPAGTTPPGCTLVEFSVLQPDPEPLAAIYAALNLPVPIKRAERSGFEAIIESPRGTVLLTSL